MFKESTKCQGVWASQISYIFQFGARTIAGATLISFLGGCAFNSIGLVAARQTDVPGAKVVDIYSLGVHLRTWNHDPGLSFGVNKRSYVFPSLSEDTVKTVWYYGAVRWPKVEPVFTHSRNFGLELNGGMPEIGLTLGYRNRAMLTHIGNNTSIAMQLSYRPGEPEKTKFTFFKKE